MDEREKTINGLVYLANWLHGKFEQTGEGDYELDAQTAENAIELLKAKLPRTLKLEELLSICEEPVWLEPKSGKSYTGWVLIDNIREGAGETDIKLRLTRPGRVMICPNIDLYGSKWRCWTSKPTKEQMEAEPWATKQE